jgi:hypothetical protein
VKKPISAHAIPTASATAALPLAEPSANGEMSMTGTVVEAWADVVIVRESAETISCAAQ